MIESVRGKESAQNVMLCESELNFAFTHEGKMYAGVVSCDAPDFDERVLEVVQDARRKRVLLLSGTKPGDGTITT